MMKFLWVLVLCLLASMAIAAPPGVQQSGTVTPGHPAGWTTSGVIQDGGTPANPFLTGVGVYSNNQQSICAQNSKSGAVSQICLGAPSSGGFLTFDTLSGAALPLKFVINGATYTWPFPSAPINVPFLAATSFGVVADGTTPNDDAMANALAACTAQGTTLWLPAGQILLTGGTSSVLQNCAVIGSGVPGGYSNGTMFLLTSTSTSPFIMKNGWSMSGVNFYYPNQTTGLIVYPPLFTDDATHPATQWYLDHVTMINPYDGIVFTPTSGNGPWQITNSNLFAAHDLIKICCTGDSAEIVNVHFAPGPWLSVCPTCTSAVNSAILHNTMFHVYSAVAAAQFSVSSSDTFAWKYGIKIDSGGELGGANINVTWDGMGSIVDTASSGTWNGSNKITGINANCGDTFQFPSSHSGNTTCFNLGANDSFAINDFRSTSVRGTFISSAGSSVQMNNVTTGEGGSQDGGDYYILRLTAANAGTTLTVQGSNFSGITGSSHSHGITTDVAPAILAVETNGFIFFNDVLNFISGINATTINGNWSVNTNGSVAVMAAGITPVSYFANFWDKPLKATVASCGSGATVTGGVSGTITVGSTNPTTSCNLTLPLVPLGGTGSCAITSSLNPVVSAPGGTPPTWFITSVGAVDIHNQLISFNCPGVQ